MTYVLPNFASTFLLVNSTHYLDLGVAPGRELRVVLVDTNLPLRTAMIGGSGKLGVPLWAAAVPVLAALAALVYEAARRARR